MTQHRYASPHDLRAQWWVSYSYDADTWRVNTLKPRQKGRYLADDILNCISFNEKAWISIEISLKIVPCSPIYNVQALVQILAWRRTGDKPLPEWVMA